MHGFKPFQRGHLRTQNATPLMFIFPKEINKLVRLGSRVNVECVFTAVALGTNYALGSMFPHLRPFMVGLSPNYLGHAAENSFPSDHATMMWVVAFAFFLNTKLRIYGWAAVALATLTSWARVFLGVHFPFDILGSIMVAAFTLAGMQLLRPWIERAVLALTIQAGISI